MINYPPIFRGLLLGCASLFFIAVVLSGVHQSARQRTAQITRITEAAHRPTVTNALPMQGGWGFPAAADEPGSSDSITRFFPATGSIQ